MIHEVCNKLVREAAVKAIGDIFDLKRNEKLMRMRKRKIRALRNKLFLPILDSFYDEEHWVRYSASRALGKLGDRRAIEHLHRVYDENKKLRPVIKWGLRLLANQDEKYQ
jgi:HEAT repeat protein